MLERQELGEAGVDLEVGGLVDHEDRQQDEEDHHQAAVAEDEVFKQGLIIATPFRSIRCLRSARSEPRS